jgi:arabinan endo-1,5-alpha-L-arabinosidase
MHTPRPSLHPRALLLCALALVASLTSPAFALDGTFNIHDPSRIIKCNGVYYVFGTGRGIPILSSTDCFTWQRAGRVFDFIPKSVTQYVPNFNGAGVWAPDIILVNGQYCIYYAVSVWNSFISAVGLVTSPTLDPKDPAYKWTDRGMVVHSVQGQALNAIDPGVVLGPDGRLWLSYGSYHGNIELVELDPKTGLRIAPDSPVSIIASRSEASELMYHGGYYYLFVNHGSCCQGVNSTYNIRVGRSRDVTGPYLDRFGDNLNGRGGTLFLASQGNDIGPGHFGPLDDDGVEKFSCHYEGVIGGSRRSILAVRPLLWTTDGWPIAGSDLAAGAYQICSLRTGSVLQSSTSTVALPPFSTTASAVVRSSTAVAVIQSSTTSGTLAQSSSNAGTLLESSTSTVTIDNYLVHDNQIFAITPAGGGFYKIADRAGHRALEAAAGTVDVAPFTGADTQLWKIDQLDDGTYRIASKPDKLALTAPERMRPGSRIPLQPFTSDPSQHWVISAP